MNLHLHVTLHDEFKLGFQGRGIVKLFQLRHLKKIHVQLHRCEVFWFYLFSVFVDSTVVSFLRSDYFLNNLLHIMNEQVSAN